MSYLTRRTLVKGGTAVAAAGVLTGPALLEWAKAWAQNAPWKPEKGAKLSMLRWKYFVQSEDDAFVKLIEAFTKATGVRSRSRANRTKTCSRRLPSPPIPAPGLTCSGASIRCRIYSRKSASTSPTSPTTSARSTAVGSTVPCSTARAEISGSRSRSVTRAIWSTTASRLRKKPDSPRFPDKTDGFLEYAKAMKKNNTPGGFALGHASGDGNGWVHWCLWSQGGNTVDKSDKVIINSPETAKALEYAKALYAEMIPGVASWNDASNNKAFLAGEINWTDNGISIYVAAQKDPTKKNIADDMDHSFWPVGPEASPPNCT